MILDALIKIKDEADAAHQCGCLSATKQVDATLTFRRLAMISESGIKLFTCQVMPRGNLRLLCLALEVLTLRSQSARTKAMNINGKNGLACLLYIEESRELRTLRSSQSKRPARAVGSKPIEIQPLPHTYVVKET